MIDSTPGLDISSSPRSERTAPKDSGGGCVIARTSLSSGERDQMFALFSDYFAHVTREVFEHDLDEKDWVILLRDDDGSVSGFSTLMRLDVDGHPVFFSGDTIVARHRRSTTDLPRLWVNHIRSVSGTLAGDIYWFLISSGYRTYRFLPVFFREFHPRFDGSPAQLKSMLDTIASRRFGAAYDPASGIVHLPAPSPLRDAEDDLEQRAQHDPHVRFFLEANPGHAAGDELACLVRVAHDNLTPAGARMLR
ncbi:MAG TPA: hypothetical protein VLV78_23175 [Thermoanaerobaculia bacterium]|nr:hypothetical protein [Thermoanaerobaculia bacterium]